MSYEVGYHIAPKNKYYVETTTVVEETNEPFQKSESGFIDGFAKDWECEGKVVMDKSEMTKHDFLDFINRTVSSKELEENGEQNMKITLIVERIESHKEKTDEENSKKHEEEKYSPIEEYDKTQFVTPKRGKKKGFIRKIKEKLHLSHNNEEEEQATPSMLAVVAHADEGEHKEKKGIIEKIKEKIPRYNIKREGEQ